MIQVLPGDAVRSKRRIYWHYGIYVGEINGKRMVFENTFHGVRLVSLEDFSKGKECEFILYTGLTKRENIITRANSILGKKKYNLLKNNCEHFVNWCQEGKAESSQVRTGIKISAAAIITAVGIGIAGKIIRDKLKRKRISA